MDDDKRQFFEELGRRGVAAVRAGLESRIWGVRENYVREWLAIQQEQERDAERTRAVEALDLSRRAVDAAERSALASELAAKAAKESAEIAHRSADIAQQSAYYARAAAWGGAISAIAAVLTIVLEKFFH